MASKLKNRIVELRKQLLNKSLPELADRSGADLYNNNILRLHLFDKKILISFPELIVSEEKTGAILPDATEALLLYYLITADGTPLEGRWISFGDLPDGRFYERAFQGYTGVELIKYFGSDLENFESSGTKLGGLRIAYGDSAFAFHILPRVMIAVIFHRGDDEFDSSCRLLFDASTSHYLPTDVCAILGSLLTRKFLTCKPDLE
jgi:hypothetical protein